MNWKQLFEEEGVRWFHCGGIFAALSATTAGPGDRGHGGRARRRHGHLLRSQLPRLALEIAGRHRARRRRQPPHRLAGGRDDRQRRGFHRALGFQVPGMDEHISKLDPANFRKMIAEVVTHVPEFQGRGHHAAQCQDRHAQRLGRDPLDRTANSTKRRCARIWKSSTASAAATASPPASPTGSSPARPRRRRCNTARPTARWP